MAAAGGPGLWDSFLKLLQGGAQAAAEGAPQMAQGAAQGVAQAGQGLALSPDFTNAVQNAATQAVAAGAGAPGRAPAGAAQIQGLTMQAQNPQLAQAPAQMGQPQTGLNIPTQMSAPAPVPAMNAQLPDQHPMTQGVGNWPGEAAGLSPERGWWDTVVQNLTGRDAMGNPLQGEDLANFQKGHAMGAFLGGLGAEVGGENTFGGRLGKGIYQQSAGNLSAMNAERQQMNQNDYMIAAARAMMGGQQEQQSQTPSGPEGPIKQPTGVYTPQTSGGGTGEPAEGANRTNASTYSLDETLNRLRKLNSGMF